MQGICIYVRYETLGLKIKISENKAVPETLQWNEQLKLRLF